MHQQQLLGRQLLLHLHFLSLSNHSKCVSGCLGIQVGKCTPDGKFSLNTLRCVGACGLAPVAMIGDKVYGRLTPDLVPGILAEYK